MEMNTVRIAAAYIRVSTDDQLEYSPDSQLKLIREYAKKNDYHLPETHVYVDEGITGRNAEKRDAFQRMIGAAKQKPKPFDAILLWKFSRFARNQEESITYKSLLRKQNGIDVISISEPMIDGPFGSLIERIIEWFDEYYSINLAQEVKRGMTEKVSRGEPVCRPAFGYDMHDGGYYPNQDAETVRRIFNDYLSGLGCRTIAIHCAADGVRTSRGNPPDSRFIEYILRNPVYTGKIRWSLAGRAASRRDYTNKNIVVADGRHEPIIENDIFDQAQMLLDDNKKKYAKYQRRDPSPAQFMLKGLVKCGHCDSTLVMLSTACPSLQCHSYGKGGCSVSHSLSVKKANQAVVDALQAAISGCAFSYAARAGRVAQTDYEKLLSIQEVKLKRIQAAYIQGVDTLEEYKKSKKEILKKVRQIKDESTRSISESKPDIQVYTGKTRNVLDMIQDPHVSESAKNEALRTILSKIVYEKACKRLVLYFYI